MRRIKFDAAKFCMEGMDGWLMLRIPTRYRMPARALVQEISPDKLYDAEIKRHRQKTVAGRQRLFLAALRQIGGYYRDT